MLPAQCLFSSIVTPRNVVCVACSMFAPFKTTHVCSRLFFYCFYLFIIQFVLFSLSDTIRLNENSYEERLKEYGLTTRDKEVKRRSN